MSLGSVAATVAILTLVGASPAFGEPTGAVTEFSGGLSAQATTRGSRPGPDGNLWFTEVDGNRIGRITPAGAITEFSPVSPPARSPDGIAAGPDGNLWFTERSATGDRPDHPDRRRSPSSAPASTPAARPRGITAGPDGNLWFTDARQRHQRSGGSPPTGVDHRVPRPHRRQQPRRDRGRPGRQPLVHRAGGNRRSGGSPRPASITEFTAGLNAGSVPRASRPARTATSGSPTPATTTRSAGSRRPASSPSSRRPHRGQHCPTGSRPGPDGNLWFTENDGNAIGRITTAGVDHRVHRRPQRRQPASTHRGRPGRQPLVHRFGPAQGDRPLRSGRAGGLGAAAQRHRVRHSRGPSRSARVTAGPTGPASSRCRRRCRRCPRCSGTSTARPSRVKPGRPTRPPTATSAIRSRARSRSPIPSSASPRRPRAPAWALTTAFRVCRAPAVRAGPPAPAGRPGRQERRGRRAFPAFRASPVSPASRSPTGAAGHDARVT